MKLSTFVSLLFSLLFFSHHAGAASSLTFDDAWIAEAPPASKVMVAYMTISNSSAQVIKIVAAGSESFKRISFHQTQQQDDMATMQHMDTLTIPAQGQLVLEPGSHHIMLFNPVKKLKAGDQVNFKFELEGGDDVELTVPVKKQDSDHNSHDHSSHQHH